MTTATAQLQRPTASAAPAWIVLPMGVLGAAMGAATWVGGQWPLTVVVLLFVAIAFLAVLRSPHVGISIFLTTFLINYPGVARGTGYLTINNVLGALFLGLLAWDYYHHRDAWYLREPLIRMLFAIGAALILGTLVAEFVLPDAHIQRLLVRRIGATRTGVDYTERQLFQFFSRIAFTVFVLQFVRTPRQLRGIFLTLLACILVAVPPAIVQYTTATGEEFRIYTPIVNWADNVNRFAFGLVVGIAFLYYLLVTARTKIGAILAGLGAVSLLPLVLLSASRSGMLGMSLLGLMILCGAFGAREGVASRGFSITAVAMLIALGIFTYFTVLTPKAQERLLNINPFAAESAEGGASVEHRKESMQESLALIRRYPIFGTGIGNFRWVNKYHHQSKWKPPHNSYLWAGAEGGIVLFMLYMSLFWMLWRHFGRLRQDYARTSELQFFPNWLRVYLVLVLFYSFFADIWLEVHIFLLIAAAILLKRWRNAETETAEPVSEPRRSGRRGARPRPAPIGAV
jgi:O-antigen ligase